MPSKETLAKDSSLLSRKARRVWKRGKGWVTMPGRARKPLTEKQTRNTFYDRQFELEDLLSIIRRLQREGETQIVPNLQQEAENLTQEIARDINKHAITRALRANRVLDPKIRRDVRYAVNAVSANPSPENQRVQNNRMARALGKKFGPFAQDYNRMLKEIGSQASALIPVRGAVKRTVFAAPLSPFARVRRLFRRGRGKRPG
jgi:hypothetical protein